MNFSLVNSELETNALHAYHNDPETESEEEFDRDQRSVLHEGGAIEMGPINTSGDIVYEGGGSKADGKKGKASKKGNQSSPGFLQMLLSCGSKGNVDQSNDGNTYNWSKMTEAEKKERIQSLWSKARRYNNKLRFQARLQKMAESNLKEMMIDDINEDADEDNQIIDSQPKLKWYLIDTERTFCKVWNFLITILTIYTLFASPYLYVFPHLYKSKCSPENVRPLGATEEKATSCLDPGGFQVDPEYPWQDKLYKFEIAIDIIQLIEILLNFVKKTRAHKDLIHICQNYLTGYFIFDVIATVPELFMDEGRKYYGLKMFRLVHFYRLTQPLQLLLHCALQKYSKKRQNDLSGFAGLIFIVIYVSHMMACIWLWLGFQDDCYVIDAEGKTTDVLKENCTQSWVYANDFAGKLKHTQYIFAFYWIFEVITTVGYGDYSGATSEEYIFSIILEFMGLTFFSFLMGSINGIFNTSDNFDDLIEEKLDSLDMWIKKIEKSNKPFHIQPTLYNDIRKYVEQAFLYDFNLVIEEFQFYQQITPKMQTDLIQNTRVFKEFERSFNHFFEECERGFTNELIISMYCRIYTPGKTVISYKSNVKEMYFIRQGLVEVYNNENDEVDKEKPILYLPKYSYFGDYQILYNLKSNILFKTLAHTPEDKKNGNFEPMPDIIFMCISKDVLQDLCELFPQTADNIKRRSLERRHRFMQQKNLNSRRHKTKTENSSKPQSAISNQDGQSQKHGDDADNEDQLEDFYSDEEPENFESQKEDMKMYLNKLNKRIDTLVEALKKADSMMAKMGDQKAIIEQINSKKNAKGKVKTSDGQKKSIAEFFKEQISNNKQGR